MQVVGVLFVLAVVVLVAWATVAAWVAREAAADGRRRAATWGVAVLCTGPAGLLAYLAMGRPNSPSRREAINPRRKWSMVWPTM
jgi:hypothetical protein